MISFHYFFEFIQNTFINSSFDIHPWRKTTLFTHCFGIFKYYYLRNSHFLFKKSWRTLIIFNKHVLEIHNSKKNIIFNKRHWNIYVNILNIEKSKIFKNIWKYFGGIKVPTTWTLHIRSLGRIGQRFKVSILNKYFTSDYKHIKFLAWEI